MIESFIIDLLTIKKRNKEGTEVNVKVVSIVSMRVNILLNKCRVLYKIKLKIVALIALAHQKTFYHLITNFFFLKRRFRNFSNEYLKYSKENLIFSKCLATRWLKTLLTTVLKEFFFFNFIIYLRSSLLFIFFFLVGTRLFFKSQY